MDTYNKARKILIGAALALLWYTSLIITVAVLTQPISDVIMNLMLLDIAFVGIVVGASWVMPALENVSKKVVELEGRER